MKTKVIIENGETELILTPENDFERDILEKIHNKKTNFTIFTDVEAKYDFGIYKDHKLILNIKETR